MDTVNDIAALRRARRTWREAGLRVALVPTMGNLHAGHLALIDAARAAADRVVVSVFVNPLQFDREDDLAAYPRTLDADRDKLASRGVELLFAPGEAEIYPCGRDISRVEVPGLSGILEGASRPGHFAGVATIVSKLFHLVEPDAAVFGEKDFQQLLLIRRMVRDLDFPVEILAVPTVRETDGLALSSRNVYLRAEERVRAPALSRTLQWIGQRLLAGESAFAEMENEAMTSLREAGFEPDYVSIRCAEDLGSPETSERRLIVLAAAWLGRARLIDNLKIDRP